MERWTWQEAFLSCHILLIPSVKLSVLLILTWQWAAACIFFYVAEYAICSPLRFYAHSQWSIIVLMTCQDFEVQFSIPLMEHFCVCISRLPSETVQSARWECSFEQFMFPWWLLCEDLASQCLEFWYALRVPGGQMAGSVVRYTSYSPKFLNKSSVWYNMNAKRGHHH